MDMHNIESRIEQQLERRDLRDQLHMLRAQALMSPGGYHPMPNPQMAMPMGPPMPSQPSWQYPPSAPFSHPPQPPQPYRRTRSNSYPPGVCSSSGMPPSQCSPTCTNGWCRARQGSNGYRPPSNPPYQPPPPPSQPPPAAPAAPGIPPPPPTDPTLVTILQKQTKLEEALAKTLKLEEEPEEVQMPAYAEKLIATINGQLNTMAAKSDAVIARTETLEAAATENKAAIEDLTTTLQATAQKGKENSRAINTIQAMLKNIKDTQKEDYKVLSDQLETIRLKQTMLEARKRARAVLSESDDDEARAPSPSTNPEPAAEEETPAGARPQRANKRATRATPATRAEE